MKLLRNATVFKIEDSAIEAIKASAYELISKNTIKEIQPNQLISYGVSENTGVTSYPELGLLTVKIIVDEKIIPASAIKRELKIRIDKLENKPSAKEKSKLKEDIQFELAQKALVKRYEIDCYFDFKSNWFIVGSASNAHVDIATGFVRECLGSFPIVQITGGLVENTLTRILVEGSPFIEIGHNCQLIGIDGDKVKLTNHDMHSDEIKSHIDAGKKCSSLELVTSDCSVVIDGSFSFKKIEPTEIPDDLDDDAAVFLQANLIRSLVSDLSKEFSIE